MKVRGDFVVRPARSASELRQVVRLYGKVWPGSFGIVDLLCSEARCSIIVDRSSKVVGYCFADPDKKRGHVEVQDVGVDPGHQGHGLGSRLMAEVMRKHKAVKLIADATKQKLLQFYLRLGFVAESTVENYYEIGRDGVRMVWSRGKRKRRTVGRSGEGRRGGPRG